MRVKLKVAYDGTAYHGWQLQNNGDTIEGELNKAIKELTSETVQVIGASRTDAGVHAFGNIAVFDTSSAIPADRFAQAINTKLPEDIRVISSEQVDDLFHPRHCESEKTYEYRMYAYNTQIPTIDRYSFYIKHSNCPDIEKMNRAGHYLIGEHDFKSFCSAHTQAETTIRHVTGVQVDKKPIWGFEGGYEITIKVSGHGFLYNMVRIIAGTLLEVGKGRIEPEEIENIINNRDRQIAGPTLPACGLTLVEYRFLED